MVSCEGEGDAESESEGEAEGECWTAALAWNAFGAGKIASLIGMEGTHLLGNSLGTFRPIAQLGDRYLSLTHTCHSAFASSASSGQPLGAVHDDNGSSDLGKELVRELNRVGILADLSHTTDETTGQLPPSTIWKKRQDLPSTSWGGGGVQVYRPKDVKHRAEKM
ncbi:membrane dipeptidase [Capronia epimyces CBS 606.96]|uniref:Dipeptidase n=1 Tax=Capronia epimyces CBS 606.96 TaxID=1182542 RepID=W9Y3U8_9EURO|nr:membrane dipeptidase [Capronia epimyces CBS 606.96]EXJ87188.1 membrane dipeptidase [Capronia epimyces CBS 606.96]